MNFENLKSIINEATGVDPLKIKQETSFEELKIDEVDALEISVLIEEQFNQFIDEKDILELKNLKELLGVLGWKK